MIKGFHGKYRFLSTYYPHPAYYDGEQYSTLEHAYQAACTDDKIMRQLIRDAPHPAEARRLGCAVVKRPGWDGMKYAVMTRLQREKFSDSKLADALLATGDEDLVEINMPNDLFWGYSRGMGQNMLGKLIEQIRHEIRHGLLPVEEKRAAFNLIPQGLLRLSWRTT